MAIVSSFDYVPGTVVFIPSGDAAQHAERGPKSDSHSRDVPVGAHRDPVPRTQSPRPGPSPTPLSRRSRSTPAHSPTPDALNMEAADMPRRSHPMRVTPESVTEVDGDR